ncbi:YTH domain-containing protein 1 [Thelohanellus kitauei]|uniref:YTH domain-containing protein 1 n=1 Tax=Thelohanellus kitauei TaxID=669202 RepID=A0A0C2J5H3_THEKT|nr:YTH domain-containing protein 1 [Thelohanellus kitauei]
MSGSQKNRIPIIISSASQRLQGTGTSPSSVVQTGGLDDTFPEVAKRGDKYDFDDKIFYNESRVTEKVTKSTVKSKDSVLTKLFYNSRFFVIKSNNFENVHLAKQLNVWATPPANERRLHQAFDNYPNVFLIFSVRESGVFQGFARIRQKADHSHPSVNWSLPPSIDPSVFSGIIRIDWLTKQSLPFSQCNDIRNPYNDNKEEIEPRAGEFLCRMFALDSSIDIHQLLEDINIDEIIETYDSKPKDSVELSPQETMAKSRESHGRETVKSVKKTKTRAPNRPADHHMIPKVFFDKLVELTNLPYEEYVAAVSNGRQLTTLANYGIFNQDPNSSTSIIELE